MYIERERKKENESERRRREDDKKTRQRKGEMASPLTPPTCKERLLRSPAALMHHMRRGIVEVAASIVLAVTLLRATPLSS